MHTSMQRYIGLDEMSEELVPDEDWEEKYSEQHKKKFWKNKKTGKSSWTEPPKVAKKSSATVPSATAPSSSIDGSGNTKAETEMVADEDWEEKYSEQHKRKFWKNKKTGKSSWTEPPKVVKNVSVEAASASTTAAPAPAAAVATAAPQSELVPDEDWEEKYSEQHKRKFWKNKKTGKSSWTEPPKVSKVATAEVSESSKNTSPTEASSTVELVPDEDWEEKYSEQHKRKFWKNKKTGKSSWTEPPKVVKSQTAAGAAGGTATEAAEELVPDEDWEEKYSEQHKKKFWKNKKTGKSSWTEPPKVAKKSSATVPSATAPSSSIDGSGNTKAETEMVADEDWEEKYSEQHKRKFWKNKKTGKSSWTEPPKVVKNVSVEAASASTTAAPAPAAAVATAAPQSELVPDEDWEEKYSVPHKRKFWKNKKTGKSSWTEPPKVFKTAQPSQQATEATTSAAMADSKSSAVETEAKVETIKENIPTCGILWTVENGNWSSFPAKLISRERASLLILYREYQTTPMSTAGTAFPLIVSSLEDELLNEIAASETSARDLLLGKRKKDAAAEGTGTGTGTSADGGGQGIQLLLSFKTPPSASASSAATAVASSSALASFVAKLYCNESPGRLRFVISDGAAFADIDIDKKLPAFSASVATSSTALASAATSAAVAPGKGDAQPGFKSNAATEVILMCSSKTEASLWAKILRTKVSQQQLEIFDRSEFCAGDIDRVTMACVLASAKTERACAEIDWLRCLSRALTSSASPSPSDRVMAAAQQQQEQQQEQEQEQEQLMRSNLKLVEEKVNQQLLKFSSSSSAITDQLSKSLEANRLPGDGLVVVAMTISSPAPLLFPQHDSHRGNLSHFTGQYLSLWIQLDELNHRLIFYDHGPAHDPCVFFSVSSLTHITLQDLFFEQNFLLELQHCSLLPPDLELDLMQQQEEQQQQQQISAVSVNLSFSFSTALEYWKWALSFANFIQLCKAINKQTSPSPLPLSLDSYSSPTKLSLPFSSHSHPSSSLSHLATPSRDNGNGSGSRKGSGVPKWNSFMLDFAMDSINSITDRNMIRRFMKRHSASGSEVRSLRFYSIHNRVIISEAGHTSLRIGSVLITLNGISAIGIPGRSLTELIQDIPSHSSVEIFCWEFPREIFHCQVMATSLKKTSAVTAASAAAVDSWEEQKTNEKTSAVSSSEVDGSKWMTDVRMKLEGDSIIFVSGNSHPSSSPSSSSPGWRQTLLLSNIRMRLIEVDDETSVTSSASRSTSASASGHTRPTVVALCVAIELRDKDSKVLISCSSLQVLLDLLCRIFEALKLFGTIGYDLTLFHERCLQYQLLLQAHKTPAPVLSLGLSPAPSSGHYQYSTPSKSTAAGEGAASSGTVALTTATRSDIMRAAQELESVFESLHISDSFPTVKKIHAVLNSLQHQNIANHELLLRLIDLETKAGEEETAQEEQDQRSQQQDAPDEDTEEEDLFPIKSRAPFSFDLNVSNEISFSHKTVPHSNPLRRSMSQGHVRVNSVKDASSPHVFVPPADTKERKMSILLPNGRRASSVSQTPAVHSALQSPIPILNEPGMQPLLPLLSPQTAPGAAAATVPTTAEDKDKDASGATLSTEKEMKTETTITVDGSEAKASGTETESKEDKDKDSKPSRLHLTPESPAGKASLSPNAAFEVTEEDLRKCSEVFFFLRDHPELFLDIARCCNSLSELMDLIRLYLSRILAHWSCDESHLLRFLNEIVSHHLSPPDSLTDLPNPASFSSSSFFFASFKPSELLSLVLDELCGRPDMIGFLKFISEAVGPNGRALMSRGGGAGGVNGNGTGTDTALLCSQIIEPICQRLDGVSSSGKLPVALRCIVSSLTAQTHDDERKRSHLFLIFAHSFVSRITRWLTTKTSTFNSKSFSLTEEDGGVSIGEQAQVLETVQELMKICFTRGMPIGSSQREAHSHSPSSPASASASGMLMNHDTPLHSGIHSQSRSQFSLQIHAILSRSRWLISRFIEECSMPSLPASNNQNPVRQMAGFVGLKPSQCVSCMSISSSDLWQTLLRLDRVAESSSSVWTTELRVLLSDLSPLIHSSQAQTFWKENSQLSYLLQLHTDSTGESLSQPHSGSGNVSEGLRDDSQMPPGARELVSMSWIINATRNVLKSLYEVQSGEIPHDLTLHQELVSLKEALLSRREHIELCLQDLHALHFFEELQGVYRSEILLLIEMLSGQMETEDTAAASVAGRGAGNGRGKGNAHSSQRSQPQSQQLQGQSMQRTEEEYIFTLSKLCHRQFEIEAKISNRATQPSAHQHVMVTPVKERRSPMTMSSSDRRGRGLELSLMSSPSPVRKKKSTSNSLHLLLQNVFPAENLQRRGGG